MNPPANVNYAAIVIKVKHLVDLQGLDRLAGLPRFGMQAIVSRDTNVDEFGVLFPTECQLSEEFTRTNNLYRHNELNANPESKGYLEDNRRVRAIKFKGNRSDALYMPLSSLIYTGYDLSTLSEGDCFDELNGHEICRKYVIQERYLKGMKQQKPKFSRVEQRMFPEHFDSENYFRVVDGLDPSANVIVTQKIHGTSIRIGNVVVNNKLTWKEKLARKLGINVQLQSYDMVYGSRKVIKDANNPDQQHFYDYDLWTEEGKKLDGLVPENWIVYGELVGWADNVPIQKNYTYSVPEGHAVLYVYRIAVVNGQGVIVDLGWDEVVQWCKLNGLNHVVELWRGKLAELETYVHGTDTKFIETFLDTTFYPEYKHAVRLDDKSPCDEGVCVRIDGITPKIVKAKSPIFLGHETKLLDTGEVDMETEESSV